MVDIEIPVILPELAGNDADAEALPHFFLSKRDTVFVSLGSIAGEQGGVVFQGMMGFQPGAVEAVQGDADSMAGII